MESFDGERPTGNRVIWSLTEEFGELWMIQVSYCALFRCISFAHLFGVHCGGSDDQFKISSPGQDCTKASAPVAASSSTID
jgi:hypothetical protein